MTAFSLNDVVLPQAMPYFTADWKSCSIESVAFIGTLRIHLNLLDPNATAGIGSPTNESVRHVFFILLLSEQFGFDGTPYLIVAFVLNAITMILPRKRRVAFGRRLECLLATRRLGSGTATSH